MKTFSTVSLLIIVLIPFTLTIFAQEPPQPNITITRLATELENPRGVLVLDDGRLIVAQAGTGFESRTPALRTGTISEFTDLNNDGDFDDEGEIVPIVTQIASYNSLTRFSTFHDEVNGVVDLLMLEDGTIVFTKDDPSAELTKELELLGDVGVFFVNPDDQSVTKFYEGIATINSIAYDPTREVFYLAESGLNRLTIVARSGEVLQQIDIPWLPLGQQPVPAGVALDPTTGDVLIALLSGFVHGFYDDGELSFLPGASKVVRYHPDTRTFTDEITNLTMANDVAVDEFGNIYVVEFTTTWATSLMPRTFPLLDPDAPPDPGGYARFTGRVSQYLADGSDPLILADKLDEPTNATYHDGALYVSVGQGTPFRKVLTLDGEITYIIGEIYKITGFWIE